MSSGWRVSQQFLNGLMLAVYVMLAVSQSSTAITQPNNPHKNDLLTKMEISLGTDHINFNLAILLAGNSVGTDVFTNHAAQYCYKGDQQVICH